MLCRVASPLRPNSARLSCRARPVNPRSRNRCRWHPELLINGRWSRVEYEICGCEHTSAPYLSWKAGEVIYRCRCAHVRAELLNCEVAHSYCRRGFSLWPLFCGEGYRGCEVRMRVSESFAGGECNNPHRNRGGQKQTDGARRDCTLGVGRPAIVAALWNWLIMRARMIFRVLASHSLGIRRSYCIFDLHAYHVIAVLVHYISPRFAVNDTSQSFGLPREICIAVAALLHRKNVFTRHLQCMQSNLDEERAH